MVPFLGLCMALCPVWGSSDLTEVFWSSAASFLDVQSNELQHPPEAVGLDLWCVSGKVGKLRSAVAGARVPQLWPLFLCSHFIGL